MASVKDFKYDNFKKLKPKDIPEISAMRANMTFLHNHYIHYPKLSKTSKVSKVMYDRVNQIRQMAAGLKKTRDNINAMYTACVSGNKVHDKFKLVLMQYLELLRKAERDRQSWIAYEKKAGNTANLDEFLIGPGLDDVIRI